MTLTERACTRCGAVVPGHADECPHCRTVSTVSEIEVNRR